MLITWPLSRQSHLPLGNPFNDFFEVLLETIAQSKPSKGISTYQSELQKNPYSYQYDHPFKFRKKIVFFLPPEIQIHQKAYLSFLPITKFRRAFVKMSSIQ